MRDGLPKTGPLQIECVVMNLDTNDGLGTHWVAYYKIYSIIYYFDSYGNLPPPTDLINYLGSDVNIYYNYMNFQEYGTVICGHLCITFLKNINTFIYDFKYNKIK